MPFKHARTAQINYIHGWGMSPAFWRKCDSAWPEAKAFFTTLNFLQSDSPNALPHSASSDYLITHSLGGLWALKNNIYPRRGMVFINSFYSFKPFTAPHILRAMQKALPQDTQQQMQRFLTQADCAEMVKPDMCWNISTLSQGLTWLQTWDGAVELSSLKCPILVLAGGKDRICLPEKMQNHWQGQTLITHPEAGHALPLSHPQWCIDQIKRRIDSQKS